MKNLLWLLPALALLALTLVVREDQHAKSSAQPNQDSPATLASELFSYREHGDGREVSEIGVELIGTTERESELVLSARSIGPLVKPPPGWKWAAGQNRITAREMLLLVESNKTRVLTRNLENEAIVEGRVVLGEFGRFTERVLEADGSVRDLGQSKSALPQSIRFESGLLQPGSYTTELQLEGVTRLTVEFESDGTRGAITEVASHHSEDLEDHAP